MRLAENRQSWLMASVEKGSSTAVSDYPEQPSASSGLPALACTIDDLLDAAGELLSPATVRDLYAGRHRLAKARFNLVVLGEFKRGKSTLLNALLGRDVLPTGVVPLTSVVTTLRHASAERLRVAFDDGREEEHPFDALARFVTERQNPGNRLGVESAIVELPNDLLAGGLQLVDTPGIGSVHEHNTSAAHAFVGRIDAALCVLSAEQPLAQSEREFFLAVAARVPRLILVLNKIDQLAPHDARVATEFVEEVARQLFAGSELELWAVSARTGAGVPELTTRIAALSGREQDALLTASLAALALTAAAEAEQAIGFQQHALGLPLEELERRRALFADRAAALRAACAQACDLLDASVARVLSERVNRPLLEFGREQAAPLERALTEQAEALGPLAPRELATRLEAWTDATIRSRFGALVPELEAAVAGEVGELQRGFAARVEEIVGEIASAAEDVFGARAGDLLPRVELSEPARFSFKLEDVEHMLDHVVTLGRRAVPGQIGRRMAVHDARERLLQMADRHAGRLRSALVARVGESVADYRRGLAAAVEEATCAVEAAALRARRERDAAESQVRQRQAELERRRARIASVVDQLSAFAGP